MKKYYSYIIALAGMGILKAQGPAVVPHGASSSKPLVTSATDKIRIDLSDNGGREKQYLNRRGNVNYAGWVRLGSTFYDLQTNYSMPHRLFLHSDGAVSATWTTSKNDQANYPERGSGYNYRNTSGTWYGSDSSRIETSRTGWPVIGRLSNGAEWILAHDATTGGFYFSTNGTRGSETWTLEKVLVETPYKPIWARGASNGDTIHLIYSYTDSAAAGEARAPSRKGIFAPMVYSRSLDGGNTWDKKAIMLPDYDSTLTSNGGADQYAIDVKGNTVAIVNADLLQGVIAWKSTDFGNTFTRIIADTFKYAPYSAKKLMIDTPYTNDGSADVIIDDNGNMHIFWGLGRVLDTDTTDESYSFYPGLQGIVHWSEATGQAKIIAAGGAFDRNGDGFNQLSQATYASLSNGNVPSNLNTVARLGNTSAMRQPNATIDANGNIYCVFSVPIEFDASDLGAEFRDIGVVFTTDGGTTWSNPQNLTQGAAREDDFATVARNSNGFLHMMWQQDELPGTNLQNNSQAFGNHPVVLNTILYQAVSVTDILNETIGMQWSLKTQEPNTGEVMVVNQNYPNPFSGVTNVLIYLSRPGDVNIEVRNTLGALVKSQTVKGLVRGNHVLEIDGTGLSSGVYTYSLTAGGSTVSKTFMVK